MKHKQCGGKFVKISSEDRQVTYQCTRCSKIMTVYRKIATGGSPKEVAK